MWKTETPDGGGSVSRRWCLRATGIGAASAIGTSGIAVGRSTAPGEERWRFETDDSVESSPTVVDGTVYVGSDDATLYAIDAESGRERWGFGTDSAVAASPTVVDGTVYVTTESGLLYAVTADSGEELWRVEVGRAGTASDISPVVVDGTVYVANGDGVCYAIDAETAAVQWEGDVGEYARSPPIVTDDYVFVSSFDPYLYVLDVSTGDPAGTIRFDYSVRWLTRQGDTLYAGTQGGTVRALGVNDAVEEWEFEVDRGNVSSCPTAADGRLFVGSGGGTLYAVDVDSGEALWSAGGMGYVTGSPTVAGDTVVVGGGDGSVYAYGVESGERRWAYDTGGDVGSSPTVVDGTVFVGSDDGNLYAIDAGVDGKSTGSRVLEGTLGHHGAWRHGGQSLDVVQQSSDGFDPALHAFDFPNWTGETGCRDYYCESEFELPVDGVDFETVQGAVADWALTPGGPADTVISHAIHGMAVRQTISDGHCYGMVFASERYYRDEAALPADAELASDVTAPVGDYEHVGQMIRSYHVSQLLDSQVQWLTAFAFELGLVDYAGALDQTRTAIDEDGIAPLLLAQSDDDGAHQALAYDYVEGDGTVEFHLYDPDYTASQYAGAAENDAMPLHTYTVDAETGEPTDAHSGFDQYAHIDPSISLEAVDAISTDPADVFAEFARSSVFTLHSPATLAVDAPDDATVIRSADGDGYDGTLSDVAVVLGADPASVTVTVEGTGDGEFTLDAVAVADEELVAEDSVTGTIEEGDTQSFEVTAPTDESNGDLSQASTESTSTTTGDDTTQSEEPGKTTDQTESEVQDRDDSATDDADADDGLPSWAPIAGGIGGVGALGAYIYRQVGGSDGEE